MSQRTYAIVLSLAGAGVVLALILCGINLKRAAATGPRWKRALVSAGIFMLTTLGLLGCDSCGPPVTTCYAVSYNPPPAAQSVANLRQQVAMLRQHTLAGDLPADTAAYIADDLSLQLQYLTDTAIRTAIDTPARAAALTTRDEAQAMLEGLRKDMTLYEDARWLHVRRACDEAKEIVANRRGSYPFNQLEKDTLLEKLNAVPALLDELVTAGILAPAAAQLLKADAQQLTGGVRGFRPTEMRLATCYQPMRPAFPAQNALGNLNTRLNFLEQLAGDSTVSPAVAAVVRESISADLAVLGSDTELAKLSADGLAQARAAAERAQAALKRLAY